MAVTRVCYCTREDVQRALDVKETARTHRQIDRAIESASDAIDGGRGANRGAGILKRRFYPEVATKTFDWPNSQRARPWRLWLDQHELISISTLTAGGTTIPASDYFLYPGDGPPYNRLEIDLDSSAAFSSGDTHQRAISIAGTWNYGDDTAPAGTLAAAVSTTTATTINVSDSSAVGVGDLIKVDSERMLVTGKSMLTTGQTLQVDLAASNTAVTVVVTNGSAFNVDEVILLDSERMLIVDIAGNSLTVRRAWDGSNLATHSGSTIYALRTLTVTRSAYGTTAATHSNAAAVSRQVYPPLVRDLAVGLALIELLGEQAGYARTAGSGENQREVTGRGLAQLRADAVAAFGRKARVRAV
ncbi:hypothetical protein [Thermoactinospora rubra]|uniref:hypothetical protein n=1 Tax=Thermoactinospora rubra TaxID=1088767 RepID=UPI000A11A070|nr:hypothetical protein [Thermoactinospora rubra]